MSARKEIDTEEFILMWGDNDVTRDEMCEHFGISGSTLSNRAKELGLPRRKTGKKRKPKEKEALTGGRWIPRRNGTHRWVSDSQLERPRGPGEYDTMKPGEHKYISGGCLHGMHSLCDTACIVCETLCRCRCHKRKNGR